MIRFIARRLLLLAPLLLGITFVSWAVIQLVPGSSDYFQALVLQYPQITPARIAALRAEFGLDKPPLVQYLHWLWSILHLNFGYSFAYNVPVTFLIGTRALNTLLLSVTSLIAAWSIALPLGIYSAIHQYSVVDGALSALAFIAISVPSFFSALLLLYAAFWTHALPLQGLESANFDFLPWWGKALDITQHLVLPTIALGVFSVGGLTRYMRTNMLDVLRSDYMRTARAKGLSERRVIFRHAFRNAINPLVTLFGFELGGLLSGAAFVENVLGYPGLGRLVLQAVLQKDVFLVMGSLLMGSVLLILGNLVADVMLAAVDPRIRYE